MPQYILEVPETLEAVSTPIVVQVVKQISKHLGIPDNVNVVFPGDAPGSPQKRSTLDDKNADPSAFPYGERYKISVTEEYAEEYSLNTAYLRPEHVNVFADPKLDVYIKPIYNRVMFTINVEHRNPDRTQAEIWINTMRRLAGRGKQDYLHELTYHYPIPEPFIYMLCRIHDLRENKHGYNEEIGKWLRDHFSKKFTVISDLAGNNKLFVIRENQIRIMGWYDFGIVPQYPEKAQNDGVWNTSFTYKFYIDKCESMAMSYPLMIHNQIIPKEIRDDRPPYQLEQFVAEASNSGAAMDFFSAYNLPSIDGIRSDVGLPLPVFDDWVPPRLPVGGFMNILRMIIQVDEDDPSAVVCLGSLGKWRFNTTTLNYMKMAPETLAQNYECVFKIDLYRKNQLTANDKLFIDNDLNVFYQEQNGMDPREYYHLTVNLLFDISLLTLAAKLRLCQHGGFAIKLLDTIDPRLQQMGLLPALQADGTIKLTDLEKAAQFIHQRRFIQNVGGPYGMFVVGQFMVVANRSVNNAIS